MKSITLQRIADTYNNKMDKDGMVGVLMMNEYQRPFAVTLELPWENNTRHVSCIPSGRYIVVPYSGTKFKDVFIIPNVPGRSDILIHCGNTTDDTGGCILIGEQFEPTKGHSNGIQGSAKAMKELKEYVKGEKEFYLNINSPVINTYLP